MSTKRIEQLRAKKAQVDAQLKAAEAREKDKARKADTRCCIIIGRLVRKHAEMHPDSEFTKTALKLIDEYVTSDRDRALFDLDPLPADGKPSNDRTPEPSQVQRLWNRITGR